VATETPSGGPGDPLLTVKEVAQFLRCSTRTVQRLIKNGELQAVPVGRLVRVRPAALKALIESK
jgi:excisionase family DNA binding protein